MRDPDIAAIEKAIGQLDYAVQTALTILRREYGFNVGTTLYTRTARALADAITALEAAYR